VNSALQRARATLGPGVDPEGPVALDDDQRALLARYVDAFERYDIERLVSLLAEDAVMSMPPYQLWLTGHEDIAWWMHGPGADCGRGSRLVPVAGNAAATFGHYRRAQDGNGHEAFSLVAVDVRGDRIASLHHFLDVENQFPRFGLPMRLEA
jgi:RNA polymerase sigma-70 factor (ECF subfamily)